MEKELKINVPWGHISGKSWGHPDPRNKLIFLVHGTLDNVGSFTNLVKLLPNEYYYVGIDLPGHGLSSHFPSGINLDFFNYILAIKYVLDYLNWNNFVYIGHSFGGQLGIIFSIIYPGRISKIITLDAFIPKAVENDDLIKRIRQTMEMTMFELNKRSSPLYAKNEVLESLKNKRAFSLNQEAALALFPRSVTNIHDKYKFNRDLRLKAFVYPNFNIDQNLHLIKHLNLPILILLAQDSWYKTESEKNNLQLYFHYLKKNIQQLNVKIVEGNHDVHNNNPERVAPAIILFLENEFKSKL